MRITRCRPWIIALMLTCSAVHDGLGQSMYYHDSDGAVVRADLDGLSKQEIGDAPLASTLVVLDLQRERMYYSVALDNGLKGLFMAGIDGSTPELLVEVDALTIYDMFVHEPSGHLYWIEFDAGGVSRLCPDVGFSEQVVATAAPPSQIAVDAPAEYVYWTEDNTIRRQSLSGGKQEVLREDVSFGAGSDLVIDAVAEFIYFTDDGDLLRMSLDGFDVSMVASGIGRLLAIDWTTGWYYWRIGNSWGRSRLDGSESVNLGSANATFYPGLPNPFGFDSEDTTCLGCCGDPGSCATTAHCRPADLEPPIGLRIVGDVKDGGLGYTLASGGDVNGDGIIDLVMGTGSTYPAIAGPDCNGNAYGTGADNAYVIFGHPDLRTTATLTTLDLDGTSGFVIEGAGSSPYLGLHVAGIGDLNGDNWDDIAVGHPEGDAVYVIFGRSDLGADGSVDLMSLDGITGFRVDTTDQAGHVSSAGDVNGDGFSDLAIVSTRCSGGCGVAPAVHRAAIVFGGVGAWPATFALGDLLGTTGVNGTAGVHITGGEVAEAARSISTVGDINADGIDDVLVGIGAFGGCSFLILGQDAEWPMSLSTDALDGQNGVRIDVADATYTGWAVASAGDHNGDGTRDLVIGSPGGVSTVPFWDGQGQIDVIYGAEDLISGPLLNSANLGADRKRSIRGRRAPNAPWNYQFGSVVAGDFDLNGDGFDDLIAGTDGINFYSPSNCEPGNLWSDVTVLFGGVEASDPLWIRHVRQSLGFNFGPRTRVERTEAGRSFAGLRDLDGDGFDDVAIGAPGAGGGGEVYVIFGRPAPPDIAIIDSAPPAGAIDARAPLDVEGAALGWDRIQLALTDTTPTLGPDDFRVVTAGPDTPHILDVVVMPDNHVEIVLDRPLPAGTWTTLRHRCSGDEVPLGYLPGDVNGDQLANPLDILTLIDGLNEVVDLDYWQCDLDHSGVCGPLDILQLIDLLNGAGNLRGWNDAALPDCR